MDPSANEQLAHGQTLLRTGQAAAAEGFFAAQIAIRPQVADFHAGLAEARESLGRLEEAITGYRAALRLKALPVVHNRLGVALCRVGRLTEAVGDFEAAVALEPMFVEARCNLGMTRLHIGHADHGNALIRQALALKPDHADSWQARSTAAYFLSRHADTATAAGRALAVAPDHGTALALGAMAARHLGRLTEASWFSRRAMALEPRQAEMLATTAVVQRDMGLADAAIRQFRRALALQPQHEAIRSAFIMCLNYVSDTDSIELLAAAREWERRHAPPRRPRRPVSPRSSAPLRVGLVSGDLRRHPVGYFLDQVLPSLERQRIATVCFATASGGDAFTDRLRASATGWHDIAGMTDDGACDLIEREAIDLLVDLSGHTAGGRLRLFSRRPAPVQASWIGYFGTTGLSSIDWLIADRHLVPVEHEPAFSERVARLPDSYICYAPPADAPSVAEPPSDRAGHVTYGCCNALAKVGPAAVAAWARILVATPGSRLLLKTSAFDSAPVRRRVIDAFGALGVEAARLGLEGWSPYGDFLHTYDRIDVALDPFPFCGGLTTVETLWMGVPLVSLAGDRFAGRQSLSYLSTVGHAELCASTADAYVDLAVRLGSDANWRRQLRHRLRDDMARSPLVDGPGFAGHLTALFEMMARR